MNKVRSLWRVGDKLLIKDENTASQWAHATIEKVWKGNGNIQIRYDTCYRLMVKQITRFDLEIRPPQKDEGGGGGGGGHLTNGYLNSGGIGTSKLLVGGQSAGDVSLP